MKNQFNRKKLKTIAFLAFLVWSLIIIYEACLTFSFLNKYENEILVQIESISLF